MALLVTTPIAGAVVLQLGLRRHVGDRLLAGRGDGVRQRLHLRRQLRVQLPVQHLRRRDAAAVHVRPPGSRSSPTCRPRAARPRRPARPAGLAVLVALPAACCRPPSPAWSGGPDSGTTWSRAHDGRLRAGPAQRVRRTPESRPAAPHQGHRRGRRRGDRSPSSRGDCVGYIGANGAGKSTTIKMLTGILVPDLGDGPGLRPRPGPAAHRAGPPDRCRLRAAQPAVVGPAAARVVPAARRDPPAAAAGLAATPRRVRRAARDGAVPRHPGAPAVARAADARRGRPRPCCTAPSCSCSTSRRSAST